MRHLEEPTMVKPSFARLTLRTLAVAFSRSAGQSRPSAPNQGVTLMECLVAIAVIALTSAMIAPPLFIAAATRMQNQRGEQALQIAQGELERIRFLVERGLHTPARLPAVSSVANLANTPPPTGIFTSAMKSINANCPGAYNDQQYPINLALPVDTNGDCRTDFIVQLFRNQGRIPTAETPPPNGQGQGRPGEFRAYVRVYASSAVGNWTNLQTTPASLQFTSGEGNQRVRPLAVLTTQINWSDRNFSLCQFQTMQGSTRVCTQQ
jgi:prepilin-type N-terminal cleavage/methylation domain-containing protein